MSSEDDVLNAFVEESLEHLDGIIDDLIQIEEDGDELDAELVNQVFRTLHSIKGASGFFDLEKVKNLSHVMESILDCFRQGSLIPDTDSISVLLDSADLLTAMIKDVESSNSMDTEDLLLSLNRILAKSRDFESKETHEQGKPEDGNNEEISIEEALALIEAESASSNESNIKTESAPEKERAPVDVVPQAPQGKKVAEQKPAKDQNIRVNIDLLDKLMVLAGELVLTRNELVRSAESEDPNLIQSSVQSVNIITSELQEAIMSTRMQTVGNVFSKFKRIVRDLSGKIGKNVNLAISGEDVDMDKTIIEAIGDPLTHLVRNSIDHGIEKPEDRVRNGKAEQGQLQLHAFHSAGQVVVEIVDDGAGINYEKVKEKALASGLVTRDELENMSNKDVAQLIFKPGFSTAEEVTDISGRGVGMDVVQRNLSKVGGVVDIDSVPGEGTKISIKLPLTLAIIPSLLVEMDNKAFAIPQVNLVELVRIVSGDSRNRLESIGKSSVLRIRDDILPVISLRELLHLRSQSGEEAVSVTDPDPQVPNKPVSVAVVAAGDFKYGIIVDKLLESAEIVVKPLGKHFAQSREYAGATILGDGSVALILDVAGVRTVLNLTETKSSVETKLASDSKVDDRQSLLLIENSDTEHFAIPAHMVSRIEKMKSTNIQMVGGATAINYLDDTLQLIPLDMIEGISKRKESEAFYAVVVNVSGVEVGIIAAQVRDIIDLNSPIDDHSYSRPCVMGSFTYESNIVQLLDLRELVKKGAPSLFNYMNGKPLNSGPLSILLVEDSPFFQRQVHDALQASNFDVTTANDGVEGLELLEANPNIDLVISDIEMPNMNGLEFVSAVRSQAKWSSLPVIALTSLSGEAHKKKGMDAGFSEYQAKLDHDVLIEACKRLSNKECREVA